MAFSAFVTALRALRGHGDVSQRLAELLLADVNRLGIERSKALRDFAATVLQESKEEVEEDWELVSDVSLETFAADSGSSQPWLATVRSLLLAQSRTPGGAFCEAQVTVIDRLLELPPPLVETPPSQWSPIRRQDAALQSDWEAIEALYGKESIETHADRCVIVVEDLSVVIRFDSTDADRIAVRAVGPSVTTWDEAVASACFVTLQRFRGGSLGALEALQLAMAVRRAEEPSAVDPGSLLLAAPPSQWLGLRQETPSTTLEFFSPRDVARHAAEQLQKYLSCHVHFQPAGTAEIVVHDRLAERFAAAVALQRVGAKSPTTPSLAFHGAPGQDVLRSICRRGFLMPGDWIEGTPDFVSMQHGNVKGMGVYTSPCLDTAARYSGVYDKDGVGLILVALVAPGAMWRETSRDETQKQISRWFFPPTPKEGQRSGGWVFHRGYWQVADAEASGKQSASDGWDMAFAPDSSALYDGAYNSRLFGTGTKVSEELVLASVDQLLPLLLLPFRRRDAESIPATPMPKLPVQNLPGGRRRRTLCGSRVYEYPSDPLPDRFLLCQKVASASSPSDELWAIHVDDWGSDGERSYRPALHVLFLVDEALASSEFKKEVPILVETLTGQLQGITSLVLFNSAGVDSSLCVPWGASSSFPARFGDRWAKSGARGGGNLAAGILYASDSMISKLAKETEAELLSAGAPWRRLRPGMEIDTTSGEGAVVEDVTFDFQGPSHLEVKWRARASTQESSKLSVVDRKEVGLLRAEWGEGSFSEFRLPADLGAPRAPADVAAETTFAVFTISNFAVVGTEANRLLGQVSECAAQLHCSGCRVSMMPIALGGGEKGLRLAAALRELSTGGSPWYQPFHGASTSSEMPALREKIREEMQDWRSKKCARGSVTIGQLAAKHGDGFVEDPLALPRWMASLAPPSTDWEAADIVQGQCLLFKGELPRRGVYVQEEEHRLLFDHPPQKCFELLRDDKISSEQAVLEGLGRCLHLGFALEKAAQQLRSSSLVALGPMRTEIKTWLERLRSVAEELQMPSLWIDRKSLQSFTRLRAPLRAAIGARLRGLSCGLQRVSNALADAAALDQAAEKEPGVSAWIRRVSSMRFGARVLQRATKNLPEDGDGVTEQDRWGNDLLALSTLSLAGGEKDLPRCFLTGTTFLEQLQESASLISEFEKLHPEETVYAIGCVGILIRCRRSDASDVEPWLLVVEHVSTTWASSSCAALALESEPLRDAAGELAPDVAVLDLDGSDAHRWFTNSTLYKRYMAMVFARNSLCQVPGQGFVLPVLVWVKTAELLINRPVKEGQEMSREETDWFREMLAVHLAAASATRRALQKRGGSVDTLAAALAAPDPSAGLLTEADGGPQSVCLALAAICFSEKAKPLWTKRGLERANSLSLQRAPSRSLERSSTGGLEDAASWPKRLRRLALAMLAEAVSRGCRRLVRSLCTTSKEQPSPSEDEMSKKLLWDALGLDESSIPDLQPEGQKDPPELAKLEGHSDECDLDRAKRRSALLFAPQGKYFQAGLTNCTPQGIVGSLMIHMACRLANCSEDKEAVSLLCDQLWKRDISMKGFVRAVLPGDANPGAVQAALYAQGLRYHNAKQRRGGVAPLSEPEAALRGLAREQRLSAYLDRLREKLAAAAAGQRRARRSAERLVFLSTFLPQHQGLPRLFNAKEVSDLNASRPPEDQLELLPTGLLKNHCCFPECPMFLKDLRHETDRLAEASQKKGKNFTAGSRSGLFRHLSPMTWPEAQGQDAYIPCLHSAGLGAAPVLHDESRFYQRVSEKLEFRVGKGSIGAEVLHSAAFPQLVEELRFSLQSRGTK